MIPESQRIAIAEACGWTRFTWSEPDGQCEGWQPPKGAAVYSDNIDVLPNYLCDLNAMHEAEKVLNHDNAREYCSRVAAITGQEFAQKDGRGALPIIGATLHATAAQRAEAFLRTLSLWTP